MTVRATALVGMCVAAAAQPAGAATASLQYEPPLPGIEPDAAYSLVVRDRSSDANRLSISSDANAYTVRDPGRPLAPGPGCQGVRPDEVVCETREEARHHSIFVDAGGGPDIVGLGPLATPAKVELRGGRGRDLVAGGPGGDLLAGGPGADWIAAQEGDDRLDGGTGDDRIDGGAGTDTVSYERRTSPVAVDLASGRGGQSGEHDAIARIEDVTGGRGRDRLRGSSGPNTLLGGRGLRRDAVVGRGGDDVLVGYRAEGGRGDDRIRATVFGCGPGHDFVDRAARSRRGPFPADCDSVLAGSVFVRPDAHLAGRTRVAFAMHCLYERVACAGRLELRDRRGQLGEERFRVPPGVDRPRTRIVVALARDPATRVVQLHARGSRAPERDWFRIRLR